MIQDSRFTNEERQKMRKNAVPFFGATSYQLPATSCSPGFSLVETIVAIAVMSIAIVGPITAAQRSLTAAKYSRDQMTAYFLAEEALEYVHYIRDVNAINNPNKIGCWLSNGLNQYDRNGKLFGVDPTAKSTSDNGVSTCNNGSNDKNIIDCNNADTNVNKCKLYFSGGPTGTGIYSHDSNKGNATVFRRWVQISAGSNDNERMITAKVQWTTGFSTTRTITLTDYITNWKEQVLY
jgi:prepilin-type N-terminal cleavage/methylation domain-containing protein